jgi:hypothetical protein
MDRLDVIPKRGSDLKAQKELTAISPDIFISIPDRDLAGKNIDGLNVIKDIIHNSHKKLFDRPCTPKSPTTLYILC